jgi:hypothetical protein
MVGEMKDLKMKAVSADELEELRKVVTAGATEVREPDCDLETVEKWS